MDDNAQSIGMNIVTNNVRGLGDKNKRKSYFHWLNIKKIDIACLQETFITETKAKMMRDDWEGYILNAYTNSVHSRGVAILIRDGFDIQIKSEHTSNDSSDKF